MIIARQIGAPVKNPKPEQLGMSRHALRRSIFAAAGLRADDVGTDGQQLGS